MVDHSPAVASGHTSSSFAMPSWPSSCAAEKATGMTRRHWCYLGLIRRPATTSTLNASITAAAGGLESGMPPMLYYWETAATAQGTVQ